MGEKHGLKETKELVRFVLSLAEATVGSLDDGKIGLTDAMRFFGCLKLAGPALKGLADMKDEIMDLSENEKQELIKFINDEFDLKNDMIEKIVEQSLAGLICLVDILVAFRRK